MSWCTVIELTVYSVDMAYIMYKQYTTQPKQGFNFGEKLGQVLYLCMHVTSYIVAIVLEQTHAVVDAGQWVIASFLTFHCDPFKF